MGLANAQYIASTGINSQSQAIQTVGNNLANVNTNAYKQDRVDFANLMYNLISGPFQAQNQFPGRNPLQAGTGVQVGSISTDLSQGTVGQTGRPEDFSISGSGYFIVRDGTTDVYTRNGTFNTNANATLTTSQGFPLQGYGVDANYNIVTDKVTDITIPIGDRSFGQATSLVKWNGTLGADGTVATQATIRQSTATTATSLNDALSSVQVGARSLINDGSGSFAQAVTITYAPEKGAGTLADATMTFNPGDPLSKLTDFITSSLEINTNVTQPTGNTPGSTLGTAGEIRFTGNLGTVNDFNVRPQDFVVTRVSDGTTGSLNLDLSDSIQTADGESAATSNNIYDSNGQPVDVDISVYLDQRTSAGTTWRVLYASPDENNGTSSTRALSESVLQFDNFGALVSNSNPTVSVDLDNRDAVSPLVFNNDFSSVFALGSSSSTIGMASQDGLPNGTLTDFGVQEDGVIVGFFSNGGTKPLGQVLLAQFPNASGLLKMENGLYQQSAASGDATFSTPGSSVGTVANNSLEASNVDVADSLIQLVQYSVAFGASSRTFATSQELFDSFSQLIRQL